MARESAYQRGLIHRIKQRFPGCYVTTDLKQQGLPDILILFGDRWAMLEVKKSANEQTQPNQEYWVDHYNGWSFCAFIYPENEEQVLSDLQSTFRVGREACAS
jgi:hypothetical protein